MPRSMGYNETGPAPYNAHVLRGNGASACPDDTTLRTNRVNNAAAELPIGQVFEGKYKIIRELGRGGFGFVYLAFQENMDRHVALKVLRSNVTAHAPSAKDRFLREVKIISKLRHPNTVTIHDFGETYEGGLYMVLEFVEGETLKAVLKREGAQDVLRAADVAKQVARSLAEAHRHGVVHRDLKPANIMISQLDGDFVKVLDFGVARLLDTGVDDLTSAGLPEGERELVGTPRYMSPEQVRGESLTGASDIYGLGLMLYEILSGEPAVQGDTTMGLITQQISPEPLKLPYASTLHPMIQDIVRIATAKQVHDRFQTAEQMAEALEQTIFQVRRERNLTGPQSGEHGAVPMSGYQSQLAAMVPNYDPGGSGFQPNHSGYHQQSGFNPHGSGFNPQGSGYHPHQSGYNPHPGQRQPGPQHHPSGQHHRISGQFNQMNVGPGFDVSMAPAPGSAGVVDMYEDYVSEEEIEYWSGGPGVNPDGTLDEPPAPAPVPARAPQAMGGGFGEIDLPADDEYNPTVERSALDQSIVRPQSLFERNQHPSAEMPEANLPPVPVDHRPFSGGSDQSLERQEPPRASTHSQPAPVIDERPPPINQPRRPPPPGDAESMGEFTTNVLKACLFGTGSIIGVYLSFIIVGAVLGSMASGMARLLAAAAVAIAPPAIAAYGESASDGRSRMVESGTRRIARALLNSMVFSLAIVILGSGACSNEVVYQLQSEPNWFLANPEGSGFAGLNKRVSYGTSTFVAEVAGTIGLYDKKKHAQRLAQPGAPGRTKALPPSTRKGMQMPKPTRQDSDATELRDSKKPNKDYEEW